MPSVYVYVIAVFVFAPGTEGLKLPPAVTPVPVYVPPDGLPPVKVKVGSFTQTSSNVVTATVGKSLTLTVIAWHTDSAQSFSHLA